jgi:hypothetical protein
MPTENDDPIAGLFKADFMDSFKLALRIQSALGQAYTERTGLPFEQTSPYTTGDAKRANRILACEGIPCGSRRRLRHALDILRLNPKA